MDASSSGGADRPGEPATMVLVRWRSGMIHSSVDGRVTVCGSVITADRATVLGSPPGWPELIKCFNCAYRRTPPGYMQPHSGQDLPLKKVVPNDSILDACADPVTTAAGPRTAVPGPRGSRANEQWTEGDYAELVELLRDGLPIDDIATNLGRGRDAVLSRCQQLLPAGQRAPRGEADLVLRLHLMQHPNDDWLRRIRHDFQRNGRFFWDQAADVVVRAGWDAARPLAELVAATGASELQVATRLVELGLAARTTDVAARLGSESGGTLDIRARLSADRAAAAVWVLIADGLRGSERAKGLDRAGAEKRYRHVSVHADAEHAQSGLERLLVEHARRGGGVEEVELTLAERTVGDLAIGETRHEHAPRMPNAPEV